mgnify:CR=1 FL=1
MLGATTRYRAAARSAVSNQPSGLLLSPRFPTPRNVYRDDCRFVVGGTGREPERAKAGYHRGDGILPFVLYGAFWGNRCVRRKKGKVLAYRGVLSLAGVIYSAQQIGICEGT